MPATAVSANVNTTDIFVSNSTHFAFGVDGSGNANSHIVFNGTNLVIDSDSDAGSGGAIILDSGGNGVGIGTTNPVGVVEILDASNQGLVLRSSKSASANTQSRLYGGAYSGSFTTIAFLNASVSNNALSIGGGTATAEPATQIEFYTGAVGSTGTGTLAMRIDSSGNVGIDTNTLYVNTSTNKVGIGTDSPAGKMEILDSSNQGLVIRSSKSASAVTQSRLYGGAYTSNYSTIAFLNASVSSNALSIGGGTTAAEPATQIEFYTGAVGSTGTGTLAMRIDSSGNVGIGTSSPARTLHVDDVMRLEPRATAPSSPSAGDIFFNSSTNKLQCYDGSVWQDCF